MLTMADKPASFDSFLERTEAFFREAAARDLPPFLTDTGQSTPLNATPYLLRYELFRDMASQWTGRAGLAAELDMLIQTVEARGLAVDAVLIGGSFTELDKPEIGDIDCLLYYRISADAVEVSLAGLGDIQRAAKSRGVDARLVPLDGDPLALVKLTSYFTILYSKHKNAQEIVRCLLLLDCRGRCRSDHPAPVASID